jgi:hypothetical protein
LSMRGIGSAPPWRNVWRAMRLRIEPGASPAPGSTRPGRITCRRSSGRAGVDQLREDHPSPFNVVI